MKQTENFDEFMEDMERNSDKLPEHRTGENIQYSLTDGVKGAFGVFFTQSASFLAYQRLLEQNKGRSNAQSLFRVEKIPSDNQIRNLLDPVEPERFYGTFERGLRMLERTGKLDEFRGYKDQLLVSCDGTITISSQKMECPNCKRQILANGKYLCAHYALLPVIVKAEESRVVVQEPEFIVPQDGHEKQDCERAAIKRWLKRCGRRFAERKSTILGDDLYACQPICELILAEGLNFILVCKPDSHVALYEQLDFMTRIGGVGELSLRRWNGRFYENVRYRFANDLPLRYGDDALSVNWCEITVTCEKDGKRLYYNTFITNHTLSQDNVVLITRDGRARWKSENENHNVLKTKGYHLEHNFGHGKQFLANTLVTLNLLAFLLHTLLDLLDERYQLLRSTLVVRKTFFNDLRALLRYFIFDDWAHLMNFMLTGLELLPDI